MVAGMQPGPLTPYGASRDASLMCVSDSRAASRMPPAEGHAGERFTTNRPAECAVANAWTAAQSGDGCAHAHAYTHTHMHAHDVCAGTYMRSVFISHLTSLKCALIIAI